MTRLENIRKQIENITCEAPQASDAQWKSEWETGNGAGLGVVKTISRLYETYGDSEENFYTQVEHCFNIAREHIAHSVEVDNIDRARVARHMMDLYSQVMEIDLRGEEFPTAVEQFIKEHQGDPFVSERFTY